MMAERVSLGGVWGAGFGCAMVLIVEIGCSGGKTHAVASRIAAPPEMPSVVFDSCHSFPTVAPVWIVNRMSGLCLGVPGADHHTPGAATEVNHCVPGGGDHGADMAWRIVPAGDGHYRLENVVSHLCLGSQGIDPHGVPNGVGTVTGVYPCASGAGGSAAETEWDVSEALGGYLKLTNVISEFCLSVRDSVGREVDHHDPGETTELAECEDAAGRHRDSDWTIVEAKGGLFVDDRNNGSANCNDYCARHGGACEDGRVVGGEELGCGRSLAELAQVSCVCWKNPCSEANALECDGRVAPIRSCSLEARSANPDLSLYVVGLNHDRIDGFHYVGERGVEELSAAIAESVLRPEDLVVALSESNNSGLHGQMADGDSCDAGDFIGDDHKAQNGECVANALQRELGNRLPAGGRFEIHQINNEAYAGPSVEGGHAVITGPRWRVVSTTVVEGGALAVQLLDSRNPSNQFDLFIVHTNGSESHAGGAGCKLDLETVQRVAWESMHGQMLTPIVAGDFNCAASDCADPTSDHKCPATMTVAGFMSQWFTWSDQAVTCPADGRRPAVTLAMEDQIMHVLVGRMDAPAGTFRGTFRPVAARFSQHTNGVPVSCPDGIWLPALGHNVVSMDFALDVPATPPRPCPEGKTRCGGECVDLNTDESHCGTCTRACGGDRPVCSNGFCEKKTIGPHGCTPPAIWCKHTQSCAVDPDPNWCAKDPL